MKALISDLETIKAEIIISTVAGDLELAESWRACAALKIADLKQYFAHLGKEKISN